MTAWRRSFARLLALVADRLGWWARRLGIEAAPAPIGPVLAPGAPIAPPEHWLARVQQAGAATATASEQRRNEQGESLATASVPGCVPRANRPADRCLGVLRAIGATEDTKTAPRHYSAASAEDSRTDPTHPPLRRAFGFPQTAFEQAVRVPEQPDLWPALPARRVEEAPDALVSAARLRRLAEEQQER